MAAPRDKFGRPIVVVTGMGVVTSLGAGKTDNWAKLSGGESGIRTISRFPIESLKTTMAGTVDFIPVDPFTSSGLSERLADEIKKRLLVSAEVHLVPYGSLPRDTYKARLVEYPAGSES